MGVCKFYLAGYCRYGNRCNFEHVIPQNNYTRQPNRGNEILVKIYHLF